MTVSKPNLKDLALRLVAEGPHKVLPTPKRVRILHKGAYIADSTKARYVWEHPYYPQYYLPKSAFDQSKVSKGDAIKSEDGVHIATLWKVAVGDHTTDRVICFEDNLNGKAKDLSGLVKAEFNAFDRWLEEDTLIFVHPKDPFKRVDIVSSSRPLKVEIDGHTIASAPTSMHLYETGLPVRYYLPLTSIDVSKLKPSNNKTQCPYKGEAEYYHVAIGDKEYTNIVWFYNNPTIECAAVTGLCCFYNEKVDISIMENGEWVKLERPNTPFG
ncbi:hypothetical protein MBLNU457_g2984t2 [Dothideomycetes sp. NU457]